MPHQENQAAETPEEFGLPAKRDENWPEIFPEPLQKFWDYCQTLRDPQSNRFMRSGFTPEDIPSLLNNIQIIELDIDAKGTVRYRWRLSGTELRKYFGRDLTGCFMDEVFPPEVLTEINRVYESVLAEGRPHYLSSSDTKMADREFHSYQRIIIPFHQNDGDVQLIGYWHWLR